VRYFGYRGVVIMIFVGYKLLISVLETILVLVWLLVEY
jgi:hypothetical protein